MPSKSKSSKRHPSSDPAEPKSHPNPASSNPIEDPPAPASGKNPNPKSFKPHKTSSPTPALPKAPSKSSDPMTPDDPAAASPSRKSDRKRKARDYSDDVPPAAKSPQAGQRRLADENAVALLRAAIDFRSRTGSIPLPANMSAFYDSVKASLPTPLTKEQVCNKLRHLRQKFQKAGPSGSGPNDGLVHELCIELWAAEDNKDVTKDQKKDKKGTLVVAVENGEAADEEEEEPEEEGDGEERVGGVPDSLPYVRSAVAEHWKANGLWGVSWEVGLKRMDSSKARALEEKWRRQLGDEMRFQMDWCKTSREILALLNDAYKGYNMPRGKRFRDIEFQHTSVGSTSDHFLRSQQNDEPQQPDELQQYESHTQHESQSEHAQPADCPDTDDVDIQDGLGRVRRIRGPTRALDVWTLYEDEKFVVHCNELGQPIKKAASILSTFLESVARKGQLCPLNYTKWNEMLSSYKVELLRVIEKKFVLPANSHDWVLKSVNRKWKEYKEKLKADWKHEGMTEEEVARVCPLDVISHQWRGLVHYWFSEKAQMDDNEREPGKVEFDKMTHTHRDGSFVREESKDIVDRATNLISERVGESSSDATNYIEAQVLAKLMGSEHYGQVRGYSVGVTPTQLSAVGMYTRNAREDSNTAEFRHLQATIEELKQNQKNLQSQLANILSLLQRFLPSQIPNTSNAPRDNDNGAESRP
ncbi:uncharacterized protein LOC103701824 isoform X1 [Phoenix dactylifera]|uniref:Uncharacterized protein LOC103701824 isoform X1 n=1 Tax=Phoenix dactylifera TaxID=42345 RepID=A0A8B7BNP5_PHODC|nr:uncharacterized protein LOC103701824 isoform X1 [Phoenix dactylifera]